MKEQIQKLEQEEGEQITAKYKAIARIKEIKLQIRKLRTLEKKMNAVLGNLKGDEIKVTS